MLPTISNSYNQNHQEFFSRIGNTNREINRAVVEVLKETPLVNTSGLDLWAACDSNLLNSGPARAGSFFNNDTGIFHAHVTVSPLWAIDWNDLPKELSIDGPEDSKLNDRAFFQKFSDWIAEKLRLPKSKVTVGGIAYLLVFLRLRENPEMLKKTWRSMIAHELGHISHHHSEKKGNFQATAKKIAIFFAFIVTPVLAYIGYKIACIFQSRKHEYEADKFSAVYLRDSAEGISYGCTAMKKGFQDLKNSKALTFFERIFCKMYFIGNDDLFGRFTHGSTSSRVNRVKQLNTEAFSGSL